MLLLEDLQPAPKVEVPKDWRPAVEFNGSEGEATTQGFLPDEKPDFDTATKYLEAGNFYWNSGIFMFKAGVFLEELKKY